MQDYTRYGWVVGLHHAGHREAHLQARHLALPAARDLASMLHPRCVLVVPGASLIEAPVFCIPVTELANREAYAPILDALLARL